MSRRISEINDYYIESKSSANRILETATKLSITYFEDVSEVPQGYYDEKGCWCTEPSKYRYAGCSIKNTYGEANNDRNADIDSKIGTLDSRIEVCNTRKNKLNELKRDCNESLKNLKEDKEVLKSAKSSFNSIKSNVTTISNAYSGLIGQVNDVYHCIPTSLDQGTNQGIVDSKRSFSNGAISCSISDLSGYIDTGETIKSGITTLVGELDNRITELNNQKSSFQGMKR